MRIHALLLITVPAILIALLAADGRAVAAAAASDTTAADSTAAFPDKMQSREAWENVVSLPGLILYAPFWLTFELTEQAIAVQSRYRIGNRVAALVISPDGSRGIIPVYSSRGGLGVEFFKKHIPNEEARFNLAASWGLRGRSLYQVRVRRVGVGPLTIGGQFIYRNMPDERFFGFGPNTAEADETNYQIRTGTAELAVGRWFTDRLLFGAIVGANRSTTGPGKSDKSPSTTTVFPDSTLPGLNDEITTTRFQLGLLYEGANRPVRPSGGWIIESRVAVDKEIERGDYAFTQSFLDVIRYVGLKRDRTLFLRGAFSLTDRLEGKEIPFYETSQLGSHETIRGFHRNRFRDLDAILATVEYRYPISAMIDALLFVDAGQVQTDIFRDFTADETQLVFGGGFRVWKLEGTLIRLEFGVGEDGFRVLFELNPSGDRRSFSYF